MPYSLIGASILILNEHYKNKIAGWKLYSRWLIEDYVRCSQCPVYIVAHIADKTETRNIRCCSMLSIDRDDFVFLPEGLRLALLVLFCLFHLLAEVALAITMHLWIVLIDTKLLGYFSFIDLVVGAQSEVDHALSDDRDGQ